MRRRNVLLLPLAAAFAAARLRAARRAARRDPHRTDAGLPRRPGRLPQRLARLPARRGSGGRCASSSAAATARSSTCCARGSSISPGCAAIRSCATARELRLLAVPLFRGKPLYQSYLIVPATDQPHALDPRSARQGLRLLRSRFQLRLPLSRRTSLVRLSERPDAFFGRTLLHLGAPQGGRGGRRRAGAGRGGGRLRVGDAANLPHPDLTAQTRIVERVARVRLSALRRAASVCRARIRRPAAACCCAMAGDAGRRRRCCSGSTSTASRPGDGRARSTASPRMMRGGGARASHVRLRDLSLALQDPAARQRAGARHGAGW
ncbi:MAG: hypothetical protein MZW92_46640 [Comamonadaceae bacterium]|nr:hypothetical protein [Comamonadaceae bacterium]